MRLLLLGSLMLVACEGPAGPQGPTGTNGSDGSAGAAGQPGQDGSGAGPSPWVVGPGVKIDVTGLTFDTAGAHVAFTLTDGSGAALDRTGHLTEGPVDVRFVLAQLAQQPDGTPGQYTAYTTTTQTSPITNQTATQGAAESSGTFAPVDVTQGTYTYTFAAPLTGLQQDLTQTVLGVAVRTFDGVQAIDRDLLSARPDGGTTIARQEVTDAKCDACHGAAGLDAHGGRYTSPTQCVLCHQPQSSDPDTGNTVDFRVMIHKIHRGEDLPSVIAGGTYEIIGYGQHVDDFSTVEFPQIISRCTACHDGAQGDQYELAPSKEVCTSCHDTTSFVDPPPSGMVLHGGGSQPDTAPCAVCHPATGSIAGIHDKHFTGVLDATATFPQLTIQSITSTGPGQTPTVTFQAQLCQLNASPVTCTPVTSLTSLTQLSVTLAGPTTDETTEIQAQIQGTKPVGTATLVDASTGTFSYAFPTTSVCSGRDPTGRITSCAIPATATGSFTAGMEGYITASSTDQISGIVTTVNYNAPNPTPLTFAVTDATPQPRRQIVAVEKCQGCHYNLSASTSDTTVYQGPHGGKRNDPAYCVFCHNTSLQNTPSLVAAGTSALGFTVDLRSMIHKIHMGENLTQGYAIGSNNFSDLRYPRPITDCGACHVTKNWTLPMASSPAYQPSMQTLYTCPPGTSCVYSSGVWNPVPTATPEPLQPQASVCTSCHDASYTLAHAQLNTTPSGEEACATCHGPGMDWDVAKFHGTP